MTTEGCQRVRRRAEGICPAKVLAPLVSQSPKVVHSSSEAHDEGLQLKLWKMSEELTGITHLL